MTALITIRLAGSVVRSCDAKCHNATSAASTCGCCCCGENHGISSDQAVANTRVHHKRWLAETIRRGIVFDSFELGDLAQEPLFTLESP